MTPLVSVTIPTYRATDTLAVALASLRAQTVDDWECIVVDDGSPKPAKPVVEAFDDRRIRLHTFRTNRGRPTARQKAIDIACGDYIAMLDADDWYYPDKLETQLEIISGDPALAAVSTAMAVVDDDCRLRGKRTFSDDAVDVRIGDRRRPPRIGFSPTLFRGDVARSARFDPRLRRAEDPDFLMKVLGGRRFAVTRRITYAYREVFSKQAIDEALVAFRCQRTTFGDRLLSAPLRFGGQYLWSLVKTGIYRIARATGGGRWLFERRNRAVTDGERQTFERHRRTVFDHLPDTP